MRIFTWDVQYFCPLKCVYCYSKSGPSRTQATASDLWRVARAIAREKPAAVNFSGGEPSLAQEIDEIAAFLRGQHIVLTLFTSGWGLNEARIQRLTAAFDRIHVSFDAVDPEVNDVIRGKPGAHEHAVRTLRLLGEARARTPRLRFGVDCTVVTSNLSSVERFCKFLATIEGLNFINVAPAAPTGRASDPEFPLLLDEAQIAWLLDQAAPIRKVLPPSITLSIHRNDSLKHEDDRHIHLNANGEVRVIKICEVTSGNLVDEPLELILKRAAQWRSESPLAQALPVAPDFNVWRDVVRGLDQMANETSPKSSQGDNDPGLPIP